MKLSQAKTIALDNGCEIRYNRRVRLWEVRSEDSVLTYIPPKSLKHMSEYAYVNWILNADNELK